MRAACTPAATPLAPPPMISTSTRYAGLLQDEKEIITDVNSMKLSAVDLKNDRSLDIYLIYF